QDLERPALERVELEIDLEPGRVRGETLREAVLARDPDAVRVDHEVLDRTALRGIEHLEEPRMDRGLAARDLDDVRLALVLDDRVEHALDLVERPVRLHPLGAALRVADRASQVAAVRDLDEREAGVLLVV